MPKTFVFSTYGARGDVFPYLAIAAQLQKRGHKAILATSENYRSEVEKHGLEWAGVRPNSPSKADAERVMHPVTGSEYLFRQLLLPALRDSIADLRAIVQREKAAVLITHTTSLAGPIVAELERGNGLKWVSSVVSPLALFEDDAALPAFPGAAKFPRLNRTMMALLKRQFGMKLKETQSIRADLGISRGDNAMWGDAHSPTLQLCLLDDRFAPVSDSPVRKAVGFCTLDGAELESNNVEQFLREGEPPLLFVAASLSGSPLWENESVAAAKLLNKRALLLGADSFAQEEGVLKCHFIPVEAVLPRVAAMVHFGGIGTLALGLQAGTPMLLVPRSHDQPDNARRAQKLGIARVLAPNRYHAGAVAREVGKLLQDEEMKGRLGEWRDGFRNGAVRAAEELERSC
jgi:rhamnosyltransferase subunit B